MFKINGKDGTLIFTDARSLLGNKKEIPLWTIKNFQRIRIESNRVKRNWFLGFGYIFAFVSALWVIMKQPIPAWLFVIVYSLGAVMIILKKFDDDKILKVVHDEGKEFIILETEWGSYLIDCGNECQKLEIFLREYMKK